MSKIKHNTDAFLEKLQAPGPSRCVNKSFLVGGKPFHICHYKNKSLAHDYYDIHCNMKNIGSFTANRQKIR